MQEVAYNVLANPFTEGLSNWWEDNIADPVIKGLHAANEGYYEFIDWTFTNLTDMITTFPVALFNQPQIHRLQLVFMGYSVVMVTLMAMAEGFKAVMGASYTKLTTIIGRTIVAFIGAGLTVPAIIFLMNVLNMLVDAVIALSGVNVSGHEFGQLFMMNENKGFTMFITSLLFMIGFFYFICQALFQVGRRWFDLLMNMVSSPFAWAAYTTNGTAGHLTRWLTSTGSMLITNLVQAFYIIVIATIVMLPTGTGSPIGWLARFLLVLGGLHRLANPPAWLRGLQGNGNLLTVLRDVGKLVSLKKFATFGKK